MNLVFKVRWLDLWKSLSIFMVIAISIPLLITFGIKFMANGFEYSKAFPKLPPLGFLEIFLGICVFSIFFALMIAVWFKMASITVSSEYLQGRNYWGFKKRIPLTDISSFSYFSNNGINSIVVKSKYHGSVHIYEHTERRDELMSFLSRYLPNEKITEQGAAPNSHSLGA
jgi:hypothetical protein